MWTLPLCLCVIGFVALLASNRPAAATSLVLILNWASCALVVAATDEFYPVFFLVVADYASAIAILFLRSSRWQTAIVSIYAAQMICHAAYALSDMGIGPTYYSYWALTYMARLQAALIGGWIGTDLIGRWYRADRGIFGRRPSQAGLASSQGDET